MVKESLEMRKRGEMQKVKALCLCQIQHRAVVDRMMA